MFIFDYPLEWIGRFTTLAAPRADAITHEVNDQMCWDLAALDVRASTQRPEAIETNYLLEYIRQEFSKSAFRAFHATRLVRPEAILRDGLQALQPEKQIDRVVEAFAMPDPLVTKAASRVSHQGSGADLVKTKCWLVPSRAFLHDGGLDPMFDRFGGETIRQDLEGILQHDGTAGSEPGTPVVVVAALPAIWCDHTLDAAPPWILKETLAHLGYHLPDTCAPPWSVRVVDRVPPDAIEYICPREDGRVAYPLRK